MNLTPWENWNQFPATIWTNKWNPWFAATILNVLKNPHWSTKWLRDRYLVQKICAHNPRHEKLVDQLKSKWYSSSMILEELKHFKTIQALCKWSELMSWLAYDLMQTDMLYSTIAKRIQEVKTIHTIAGKRFKLWDRANNLITQIIEDWYRQKKSDEIIAWELNATEEIFKFFESNQNLEFLFNFLTDNQHRYNIVQLAWVCAWLMELQEIFTNDLSKIFDILIYRLSRSGNEFDKFLMEFTDYKVMKKLAIFLEANKSKINETVEFLENWWTPSSVLNFYNIY